MLSTYSYHVTTHWNMHKRGIVEAESIPRTINFAALPEFGGEPALWTPEHLLLASVPACSVSTFRAVAEAPELACFGAEVELDRESEKLEGGFRVTKVGHK